MVHTPTSIVSDFDMLTSYGLSPMPILALATREAREAVRARMPAFTESATSSGENVTGTGKLTRRVAELARRIMRRPSIT